MALVTHDILLRGIRREEVFEWLGDVGNQKRILEGAFDDMKETGPGSFDLTLNTPVKTRVVGYQFAGLDDSHGGRRVLVKTSGKRTTGSLHYSLRTMKPSTNTLVTLHMDFDPGGPIGEAIYSALIRDKLEAATGKVLENLGRIIPRTVGSAAQGDGGD